MTSLETLQDSSVSSVTGSSALAERLSDLPDDFTHQVIQDRFGLSWYPLSNDAWLDQAYQMASDHMPESTPDTTGVVLITGNGSFETASQLLPPGMPIVFCDINPRTLYTQRVIIETMRAHDAPERFMGAIEAHNDSFQDLRKRIIGNISLNGLTSVRYEDQRVGWRSLAVRHFIYSDEAYEKARSGVLGHAYGFRLLDFKDKGAVQKLGNDLDEAGCSIVCANFTNVFDNSYAGSHAARDVKASLPFAPGARIITSRQRASMYARDMDIRYWLEIP